MPTDLFDTTEVEKIDYNYKLIIVGNHKIGKTSLATKYVHDFFSEETERTK